VVSILAWNLPFAWSGDTSPSPRQSGTAWAASVHGGFSQEASYALDDHGSALLDVADRDGDELYLGWVHPSPALAGHRLGIDPSHPGTAAHLDVAGGAAAEDALGPAGRSSHRFHSVLKAFDKAFDGQKNGDRGGATLRIPANREATHRPVAIFSFRTPAGCDRAWLVLLRAAPCRCLLLRRHLLAAAAPRSPGGIRRLRPLGDADLTPAFGIGALVRLTLLHGHARYLYGLRP